MNEVAIFFYGLVVFSLVSAAVWLIVWGIVQERRDRETLDAGPDAVRLDTDTATAPSGKTVDVEGQAGPR